MSKIPEIDIQKFLWIVPIAFSGCVFLCLQMAKCYIPHHVNCNQFGKKQKRQNQNKANQTKKFKYDNYALNLRHSYIEIILR